jgi:hypothetical protein
MFSKFWKNAVTTGPFTIPLMKGIGYKKEFAAAVFSRRCLDFPRMEIRPDGSRPFNHSLSHTKKCS